MKTILFAYEFGAGLGHLNRLIAVAKRLSPEHKLIFALPDIALGAPVLARAFEGRAEVHQGVTWAPIPRPDIRTVQTVTFADVIRLFGFHDRGRLARASRMAEDLITRLKPDAIVADFAPTLRMATLGRNPTVVVGNGYTVPPAGRPLPAMKPWNLEIPDQSRLHEEELVSRVNEAQAAAGRSLIEAFADLFQGEATFVCTLAELDPYRAYRDEPVLWPFNIPTIQPGPPFHERRGAPVFCYFQADHPALNPLIEVLGNGLIRSELYVQGLDPRTLAQRCKTNIAIYTKPADFARVLPQAFLLVHHAGLGTAYAGLMAGTPQVVLPLNLEHAITSSGLKAFGTGIVRSVTSAPGSADLARMIRAGLTNADIQAAALAAARTLQNRRDPDPIARVLAGFDALFS